MELVQL